jgi:glycosyltransferase involved in cell wall biosynthesis
LLLDAASILKSEGRSIDIVIVGDGPERSRLEHHSAAKGLSVVFYGECYNEETLAVLIMSANVFVVPGRIGLAAMHALIYCTPVITHNDPDDQFPEWEAVIPGVNGAHFSKGDPADLARAIRTWTENILPQETIRQKCAQIIESYYNPLNQVLVFDAAVAGRSADDVALSELSEQSKVP